MIATLDACAVRRRAKEKRVEVAPLLYALAFIMDEFSNNDVSSRGKTAQRSALPERLDDYLDGYFLSFDFYPVCERHLYAKNDAYALLQDFWAVGNDLNSAVQTLIRRPEVTLKDSVVDSDDVRRRKIEAAKKAIEAIRQRRAHRDETE
jgi:hypothetical protein